MAVARRYLSKSVETGVYLDAVTVLVAPLTVVQPVVPSEELSHTHVVPLTVPSRSVKVAVSAVPTWGWAGASVTVPSSSRLVTLIVTSMVSSVAMSAAA